MWNTSAVNTMIVKRRKYFNASEGGKELLKVPNIKSSSVPKLPKPADGLKEFPNPQQDGKTFETEATNALSKI